MCVHTHTRGQGGSADSHKKKEMTATLRGSTISSDEPAVPKCTPSFNRRVLRNIALPLFS